MTLSIVPPIVRTPEVAVTYYKHEDANAYILGPQICSDRRR